MSANHELLSENNMEMKEVDRYVLDSEVLFEKLLIIENKYDFFNIKIGYVKIWQYIRFNYITDCIYEVTGKYTATRHMSTSLKGNNYTISKECKDMTNLCAKDYLVVNHPRRVKIKDQYWCVITDRLLKNLEGSYYVLEDEYDGKHYSPVPTKNLKYREIDIIALSYPYTEIRTSEIHDVVSYIIEKTQIECHVHLSPEFKTKVSFMIRDYLRLLFYYDKYYELILSKVNPKVVILTDGYELPNQALTRNSKKWGIPVIELQHGRIGRKHQAYNFSEQVVLESFPDYLFVFGQYEKNIPRYPISQRCILPVGYPELEANVGKEAYNSNVITIVSDDSDNGVVYKYALELYKTIKERSLDYRIVFKLHPSEYNGWVVRYPLLEKTEIEIVCDNLHDIYYYFRKSFAVIGTFSTVLYEALMFNVRIVIIKGSDYKKSEPLFTMGGASLVNSIDELLQALVSKETTVHKGRESFYFERDSISKMITEINRIALSNNTQIPKTQIEMLKSEADRVFANKIDVANRVMIDDKYIAMYTLMKTWFKKEQLGLHLIDELTNLCFNHIAIYGYGEIGKILEKNLVGSSVTVDYIIDKDADYFFSDVAVFRPNDELPSTDAIIVSAVYYYDEIRKTLKQHTGIPIYSLLDLVENM